MCSSLLANPGRTEEKWERDSRKRIWEGQRDKDKKGEEKLGKKRTLTGNEHTFIFYRLEDTHTHTLIARGSSSTACQCSLPSSLFRGNVVRVRCGDNLTLRQKNKIQYHTTKLSTKTTEHLINALRLSLVTPSADLFSQAINWYTFSKNWGEILCGIIVVYGAFFRTLSQECVCHLCLPWLFLVACVCVCVHKHML